MRAARVRVGMPVRYRFQRYWLNGTIVGAVYSEHPMKRDNITHVVVRCSRAREEFHPTDYEVVPLDNVRGVS